MREFTHTDKVVFLSPELVDFATKKEEALKLWQYQIKLNICRRKTQKQIVEELEIVNPYTAKLLSKSATSKLFSKAKVAKRGRPGALTYDEESELAYSCLGAAKRGFPAIVVEIINTVARYLSFFPLRKTPFTHNIPSYQWVENFLDRWGLRLHNGKVTLPQRIRLSFHKLNVFFRDAKRLLRIATGGVSPDHVINVDETWLPYDLTNKKWRKVRTIELFSLLSTLAHYFSLSSLLAPFLFLWLTKNILSLASSLVKAKRHQGWQVEESTRVEGMAFLPFVRMAPSSPLTSSTKGRLRAQSGSDKCQTGVCSFTSPREVEQRTLSSPIGANGW